MMASGINRSPRPPQDMKYPKIWDLFKGGNFLHSSSWGDLGKVLLWAELLRLPRQVRQWQIGDLYNSPRRTQGLTRRNNQFV